jgi:UDP-GlcNAc:undecaprenyl-phosphate GlcNAc-1-phosphate transferase
MVPLLALTVPLLDLALSIVRRSLRMQPIFSADRGHIHHMLLQRGLSVRQSAFALYAIGIGGGMCGLLLSHTGGRPMLRSAIIVAAVFGGFVVIRELRYPEFEVAGRLLLRGEFQKAFHAKLRMRQLARALERAGSSEEKWLLLIAAAGEWHCVRVVWTGPGILREEVFASRRTVWSFAVQLGELESIQFEGDSLTSRVPPDLTELSSILARALQPGLRDLRQPTAS